MKNFIMKEKDTIYEERNFQMKMVFIYRTFEGNLLNLEVGEAEMKRLNYFKNLNIRRIFIKTWAGWPMVKSEFSLVAAFGK